MVVVALKILHVTFAAAWFGHKLLISRDVRDSVRAMAGSEEFLIRMKRAGRLGITSGVMTLATGVGLIYVTTGFADASLLTYVGLAAVVAIFLVGGTVSRPAWNRIRSGIEGGDAASASAGEPRFRQSLLLENLLWILALGTMVSA